MCIAHTRLAHWYSLQPRGPGLLLVTGLLCAASGLALAHPGTSSRPDHFSMPLAQRSEHSAHARLVALADAADTGMLQWAGIQTVFMGGVKTHTAAFTSFTAVSDVAHALTGKLSVFDRVLVAPGQLVLSGLRDGWHWLAVILPDTKNVHGYVSAMQTGQGFRTPGSAVLFSRSPVLSFFHDVVDGDKVTQYVQEVRVSPDILAGLANQQLASQGWVQQGRQDTSTGPWQWRRPGENLHVLAFKGSTGTTRIFSQHIVRGGRP